MRFIQHRYLRHAPSPALIRVRGGFSLLEISIVLVVIGMVVASSAVLFNSYLKQSQYKDTIAKLEVIQKALLDYRRAYDRLPCPADVTIGIGDPDYVDLNLLFGAEAQLWFNPYLNSGSGYGCYDYNGGGYYPSANIIEDYVNNIGSDMPSGPPASFTPGTRIVMGMVPTRTLGLSDDYAIDGWGRRIMYAVDAYATSPSLSARIPLPDTGKDSYYNFRITIIPYNFTPSSTGYAAYKTSVALYALVSYGADGHGGWPKGVSGLTTYGSGAVTPVNTGTQNAFQWMNCNCDPNNADNGNRDYFPNNIHWIMSQGYSYSDYSGTPGGFIGTFDYTANTDLNLNSWEGYISGPTFVQAAPRQNSSFADGTRDFDDIVVYATRADLPGYKE